MAEDSKTFIDRLMKISNKSDNFTINDVKAETQTILMGVF